MNVVILYPLSAIQNQTTDCAKYIHSKVLLTQSSSFTLRLHQAENVILSDRSLNVSDNRSGAVVQKLNSDLGDTTSGTGSTQNFDNLS